MGSSQEKQMEVENKNEEFTNDANAADEVDLGDAETAIETDSLETDSIETDSIETDSIEADDSLETDDATTEPTAEETIALLEQKVAEAEAKAGENFDLLQRKAAEFQNSKRRQEKMVSEQIDRASTHLIQKILPVLDDFDLAFRNIPDGLSQEENSLLGGFQQIQRKLASIIEDEEVVIVAQEGPFDPNQHEAVSSEPNDDVESGHIIETLRLGYEHKGRTLRPALVRVAM